MPAGRPHGSRDKWNRKTARAERAAYVDFLTDNGAFVADKMRKIADDDVHPGQILALKWLAEHTTAGKVPDAVEVDVTHREASQLDLESLSLDQLTEWRKLLQVATRALPAAEPEATEAEIVTDE